MFWTFEAYPLILEGSRCMVLPFYLEYFWRTVKIGTNSNVLPFTVLNNTFKNIWTDCVVFSSAKSWNRIPAIWSNLISWNSLLQVCNLKKDSNYGYSYPCWIFLETRKEISLSSYSVKLIYTRNHHSIENFDCNFDV